MSEFNTAPLGDSNPKWSKKKKIFTVVLIVFITILVLLGSLIYQVAPGTCLILEIAKQYEFPKLPVTVEERVIPNGSTSMPTLIFKPPAYDKILMIIHGMHFGGYKEPRMAFFAKQLAQFKILVVTPNIIDIQEFRLNPRAIADIERAMLWTINESGLMHKDVKIGLMGFSFAGGLSLIVAGLPSIKDKISCVLSMGGHANLNQTLQYLATGKLPDGTEIEPQIYALAVVLLQFLEHCIPQEEQKIMEKCLMEYMKEQCGLGPAQGLEEQKQKLSKESAQWLSWCLERKPLEIGKHIAPYIQKHPLPQSLSPIWNVAPTCTVFLIHGTKDNVIPSSESLALAEWSKGKTYCLISDLILHVELEPDFAWVDVWNLAAFWSEFLRF